MENKNITYALHYGEGNTGEIGQILGAKWCLEKLRKDKQPVRFYYDAEAVRIIRDTLELYYSPLSEITITVEETKDYRIGILKLGYLKLLDDVSRERKEAGSQITGRR